MYKLVKILKSNYGKYKVDFIKDINSKTIEGKDLVLIPAVMSNFYFIFLRNDNDDYSKERHRLLFTATEIHDGKQTLANIKGIDKAGEVFELVTNSKYTYR